MKAVWCAMRRAVMPVESSAGQWRVERVMLVLLLVVALRLRVRAAVGSKWKRAWGWEQDVTFLVMVERGAVVLARAEGM